MFSRKTGNPKSLERAATDRFLILFVVLLVGIFLLDGFVLHAIPAPEGTFRVTGDADDKFDLYKRNVRYSDSVCLGSDTALRQHQTYLVRSGDEVHLLVFDTHFATLRTGMILDKVIDLTENKTYHAPSLFGFYSVTVTGGRLGRTQWWGIQKYGSMVDRPEITCYLVLALILAVLDNLLYRKLWKWKRRKQENACHFVSPEEQQNDIIR